ncbi:YbhB/YbcL family Raf kinase inhibitor-like protein [Psychromonas antarctica]|uniref:YbhB/YbcL family Raf kinase inhibitor-like protein n=1 Tax=Psychromonas antarctica TaxID=67573 RepID=UPI001EE90DEB|nr:YbhB/YbcL family Raf kinase inhibitor-like protein [Psychromonas antarctica]MCG6200016.1 YbhB/YbcL family Raf kinase inhibitor-like protein [Psychromonas antarctica]
MKAKIIPHFSPIVPLLTSILLMSAATQANESLELSSPAFTDKGTLPIQFTCEGEGISPPLNWSGTPDGTESFVVIMDHMPGHGPEPKTASNEKNKPVPKVANREENTPPPKSPKSRGPEGLRWYWTMYNIPAEISGIKSGQSVGTLGSNVVNDNNEYAPPCSKGPGPKNYTFHLYALSSALELAHSDKVSEATLRKRLSGLVLGSDSLTVTFARSCQSPHKPRPNQNNQVEEHEPPSTLPLCKKSNSTRTSAPIEVE